MYGARESSTYCRYSAQLLPLLSSTIQSYLIFQSFLHVWDTILGLVAPAPRYDNHILRKCLEYVLSQLEYVLSSAARLPTVLRTGANISTIYNHSLNSSAPRHIYIHDLAGERPVRSRFTINPEDITRGLMPWPRRINLGGIPGANDPP